MKRWLAETHGSSLELLRHFLTSLFDTELTSAPGQWRKLAIGVLATVLPLGLLMYPGFAHRYGCVTIANATDCPSISDYDATYAMLVRTDAAWLISLSICVTAMATALLWRSLFPDRRDVLALAGLPVSPRQIFGAKLAALLAALAVYTVSLCGLPAVIFSVVTAWPGRSTAGAGANFASLAAACAFAFFGLLALQGAMLCTLPSRWFERISGFAQAVLFTLSVAALPFAWRDPLPLKWWPVNWFLRMRDGDWSAAALATGSAFAAAILFYLASYYRHQRLLVESTRGRANGREWRLGTRLLDLLVQRSARAGHPRVRRQDDLPQPHASARDSGCGRARDRLDRTGGAGWSGRHGASGGGTGSSGGVLLPDRRTTLSLLAALRVARQLAVSNTRA